MNDSDDQYSTRTTTMTMNEQRHWQRTWMNSDGNGNGVMNGLVHFSILHLKVCEFTYPRTFQQLKNGALDDFIAGLLKVRVSLYTQTNECDGTCLTDYSFFYL
jgi:hypothetical protein